MIRTSILSLLILLSVGCASKAKKTDDAQPTDQQQAVFDQGTKALETQDYEEAARIFDGLLLQKPGSRLDLVTLYNSGSAYEGMGQCLKASERFRQVVRSSSGDFKRLESESLFRLSLMYECLGQDSKAIAALIDAKRRGKDLAPETLNAQIPAHLAAAYARIGNRAKALEYFNQASRGLKAIVSSGATHEQLNLIARTLFLMGSLSPAQRRATAPAATYLQSLSMQQPYLLQAVELHVQPYALKAEEDLKTAYQNIFEYKLGNEADQRDFYTRGLQLVAELKKIRMPKPDPATIPLFEVVDQTQLRLTTALSHVAPANPLTPTAQKREGLKRQGRLANPSSTKDKTQKGDL